MLMLRTFLSSGGAARIMRVSRATRRQPQPVDCSSVVLYARMRTVKIVYPPHL
jgi:hypothetical protein